MALSNLESLKSLIRELPQSANPSMMLNLIEQMLDNSALDSSECEMRARQLLSQLSAKICHQVSIGQDARMQIELLMTLAEKGHPFIALQSLIENFQFDVKPAATYMSVSDHDMSEPDYQDLRHELGLLKQLSYKDALTGLDNRDSLHKHFQQEMSRLVRYGGNLSLAVLNLDNADEFQQTYGEFIWEKCLQEYARSIFTLVRTNDLAARTQSAQFAIIWIQADQNQAQQALKRLLSKTRSVKVSGLASDIDVPLITFSAGLISCNEQMTFEAAYSKASNAALQASQDGQNTISVIS